jgi:hypothetical protein
MQQHLQREVANRRNQAFPNASEKMDKSSERESPMSTGQSSSTSRDLLNALSESHKNTNLMKPDQPKTPRRSKLSFPLEFYFLLKSVHLNLFFPKVN